MATDDPPYLTVGTDVSAKYKGAFCEAKIKKVNRVVKCKVTFKNNLGGFMVTDDQIKGPLRVNAQVDAKHPEKNQFLEAIINKLQDYSQYTVVFDDGDETTLRRTSLCLKSGRHFAESPTLDQFPLTNPEHFGTPVIGAGKFKRKRRSTMNSSLDYDGFSSDEEEQPKVSPRKAKVTRGIGKDSDIGKVVCVDLGDRRKKDNWYPGLVVLATQANAKVANNEHLVRSFKDGKYYQVPKKDAREFSKDCISKIENSLLKTAAEKAILYLEKEELPLHWDKTIFLPSESTTSATDDTQESDSDSSDDEPNEEKDRFVAQLYKFMDERGTPINKAPTISSHDLNLYKLFKIMHKLGGYNKVTNKNKWKIVYSKMGLPQSIPNGPNQMKAQYKRYLQSFEDFYRKLGCTMVSNSRSTRGRHRSDRNFIATRTRDKDTASPKSKTVKDLKEKATTEKKVESKPKVSEKKEEDEKMKTPDKKKPERPVRSEEKKKDERPRLVRSQSLNKDKKELKEEPKPEKARTREDARKEKNESPEKKGTRSSVKIEQDKKEDVVKEKDKLVKDIKKEEKQPAIKDTKEDKGKVPKKEEKPTLKERKTREKKGEEKVVVRRKDSSKEERTSRLKKEEEKSPPKKKLERLKDKKDEKPTRTLGVTENLCKAENVFYSYDKKEKKSKVEDKPADAVMRPPEESEEKCVKEEKKPEAEVKKEGGDAAKEKLRPKKRECSPMSEVETPEGDTSRDSFCRKEGDEPPNKGKRRSMKLDDKDDKESLFGMSDSDESFTNDSEKYKDVKHNEIEVGDRVKVKYGRGRMQRVYEAKVLKIEPDGLDRKFFVHYAGWNMRYDEWVKKNYIVAIVASGKQKQENVSKSPLQSSICKKQERGFPPGAIRKNSTSSTNSSCSRATRRGRSSPLQSMALKRGRSGATATDNSQGSETDDPMDDLDEEMDPDDNAAAHRFKEELFSDDEEKEKMEDVKREDITELEKTIPVEDETKKSEVRLDRFSSKDKDVREAVKKETGQPEKRILDTPAKQAGNDSVKLEVPKPAHLKVESSDNVVSVVKSATVRKIEAPPLQNLFPEASVGVAKKTDVTTKAVKGIDSPVALAEVKKQPVCSSLPSSSSAFSNTTNKFTHKNNSQPSPMNEAGAVLSFSGLIKNSSNDTPEKNILDKGTSGRIYSPSARPEPIIKNVTDVFHPKSAFAPILSTPVKSETHQIPPEKFIPKSFSNVFSCIMKPESSKELAKKSGSPTPDKKIISTDVKFSLKPKHLEGKKFFKESQSKPVLSPSKFGGIKTEAAENKPKDTFDLLLQDRKSFPVEGKKLTDGKSVFSLSFASRSFTSDKTSSSSQSHSKTTDSLSRTKSKTADTLVDVSKMIPGILERLKRDVVTDSKMSDSPPPRQDELNFDFLRSSTQGKSMSRSDSSSSLRICESDTNDSNTDSKDLMLGGKIGIIPGVSDQVQKKTAVGVSVPTADGSKPLFDTSVKKEPVIEEKDQILSQTSLISSSSLSLSTPSTSVSTTNSSVFDIGNVKKIDPVPFHIDSKVDSTYVNEYVNAKRDVFDTKPTSKIESGLIDSPKISKDSEKTDLKPEVFKDEDRKLVVSDMSKMESVPSKEISTFDKKDNIPSPFEDILKIKHSAVEHEDNKEVTATSVKEDIASVKKPDILRKESICHDSDTKSTEETTSSISTDNNTLNEAAADSKISCEPASNKEDADDESQSGKKDGRKKKLGKRLGKRLGLDVCDKNAKEGKMKSKKQMRFDSGDRDKMKSLDIKLRTKKFKKNKNKKGLSKHEDMLGDLISKSETKEDDFTSERVKRKKKNDKKLPKSGSKNEDSQDTKNELKKKKGKKRDKIFNERKDYFERKSKKKRKRHIEDNCDTDSEKESQMSKVVDKKRKKEPKKYKPKDTTSSDDGDEDSFFKKDKSKKDLPSTSAVLSRQESTKSDDPDMSFLLCEENVPASPVNDSDSSDSDALEHHARAPSVFPHERGSGGAAAQPLHHSRGIDTVLDNTPPTTPSSTESLLSSSPSHDRDMNSLGLDLNYPESTQSGHEGEPDSYPMNATHGTVMRGSEEYRAATTLAFAVCKSVSDKGQGTSSGFHKRSPSAEPPSPTKKKRKKKRLIKYPEASSSKSPKHKTSFTRMHKDAFCEDSSGVSGPASSSPPYGGISTLSFTRSLPHRLSGLSEGLSRLHYVHLNEKDPEKRIAVLQDKMSELRKHYMSLRAEVVAIDHKRRKARKKAKDASNSNLNNAPTQSEDGQNCF